MIAGTMANAMVIRTGEEKGSALGRLGGDLDQRHAWPPSPISASRETGRCRPSATLLSNPAKTGSHHRLMRESPDAWSGMLARMGNQLTRFKDTELASSLTTVGRFLKFLDTIAVAENTK